MLDTIRTLYPACTITVLSSPSTQDDMEGELAEWRTNKGCNNVVEEAECEPIEHPDMCLCSECSPFGHTKTDDIIPF